LLDVHAVIVVLKTVLMMIQFNAHINGP